MYFYKIFLTQIIKSNGNLKEKTAVFIKLFIIKFSHIFETFLSNTHWIHHFRVTTLGRAFRCYLLAGHADNPQTVAAIPNYDITLPSCIYSFKLIFHFLSHFSWKNRKCLLLLHYGNASLLQLMQVALLLVIMGLLQNTNQIYVLAFKRITMLEKYLKCFKNNLSGDQNEKTNMYDNSAYKKQRN